MTKQWSGMNPIVKHESNAGLASHVDTPEGSGSVGNKKMKYKRLGKCGNGERLEAYEGKFGNKNRGVDCLEEVIEQGCGKKVRQVLPFWFSDDIPKAEVATQPYIQV